MLADARLSISWWIHLVFWFGYTLFWHSIFSPTLWDIEGWITSSIYTLVHAGVSYLNIYYLIPKLGKQRWFLYGLSLLTAILVGAVLLGVLLYVWFSGLSQEVVVGFFSEIQTVLGSLLGSTFSGVMLTMGVFLLLQKRKLEQRQERLEQEKLTAELQFLRGQLDPHYLFNVLNNIYFLIKKDPDAAAEALAGFSDLLRYQIYEGQAEQIPLQRELDYLQRYAELAILRLSREAKVKLAFPEVSTNLMIPPLLLLPLVENAFKHSDKENPRINIKASIQQQDFDFVVTNSRTGKHSSSSSKAASGIGLENLRQRLALIYPHRHTLILREAADHYHAQLTIHEL